MLILASSQSEIEAPLQSPRALVRVVRRLSVDCSISVQRTYDVRDRRVWDVFMSIHLGIRNSHVLSDIFNYNF